MKKIREYNLFFLIFILLLTGCNNNNDIKNNSEVIVKKTSKKQKINITKIPDFKNDKYVYYKLLIDDLTLNSNPDNIESFAKLDNKLYLLDQNEERLYNYKLDDKSYSLSKKIILKTGKYLSSYNNKCYIVSNNTIQNYNNSKFKEIFKINRLEKIKYELTIDSFDNIFVIVFSNELVLFKYNINGDYICSFKIKFKGKIYSDSRGLIYIVNESKKTIIVYSEKGDILKEIKLDSSKFSLSISDDCFLYIAEAEKSKIKVYNFQYELVKTFGDLGTLHGEFVIPIDIKYSKNKIYVCEYGGNRVQIFDKNMNYLNSIPKGSNSKLQKPIKIFIDEKSNVFVLNNEGKELKVYNDKCELIKKLHRISTNMDSTFLVFADIYDRIYLIDTEYSKLKVIGRYNKNLEILSKLIYNDNEEIISNPSFNSEGYIFYMSGISTLTVSMENKLKKIKLKKLYNKRSSYIISKAFFNKDNIFIIDDIKNKIAVFSYNGNLKKEINNINTPQYMCFDKKKIYIIDKHIKKIYVFDKKCNYKYSIPIKKEGLFIAVDTKYFYLLNKNIVYVYNKKGKIINITKSSDEIIDVKTYNNNILVLFKNEFDKVHLSKLKCIMPYDKAKKFMKDNDMENAIKYFELVNKKKYLNPYLFFYLQYCYNKTGEKEKAKENQKKAKKITDRFSEVNKFLE